MEPRREPAGARVRRGLPRVRDVRQPAVRAHRQAAGDLGQDGAVPQPGPQQPARPRQRPSRPSRRGAGRPVGARRHALARGVHAGRAARGPAARAALDHEPVHADGPGEVRRGGFRRADLSEELRRDGRGPRRGRHPGRDATDAGLPRARDVRLRGAHRRPLRPFLLLGLRLLGLGRRLGHQPGAAVSTHRRLRDRRAAGDRPDPHGRAMQDPHEFQGRTCRTGRHPRRRRRGLPERRQLPALEQAGRERPAAPARSRRGGRAAAGEPDPLPLGLRVHLRPGRGLLRLRPPQQPRYVRPHLLRDSRRPGRLRRHRPRGHPDHSQRGQPARQHRVAGAAGDRLPSGEPEGRTELHRAGPGPQPAARAVGAPWLRSGVRVAVQQEAGRSCGRSQRRS